MLGSDLRNLGQRPGKGVTPPTGKWCRPWNGQGVETQGRPPIWAWHGPLRLRDASSLFDPEHELVHGFATLDLEVPDELIVLTDYGQWCDYLMSPVLQLGDWRPEAVVRMDDVLLQACLPYLRSEWVQAMRPPPRTGWDAIDEEQWV